MNLLVLIFYCTNVALFVWAVLFYFKKPHRPSLGYRVIQLYSLLIWGYQIWLIAYHDTQEWGKWLSLSVCLYSLILFCLAVRAGRIANLSLAYSKDQPQKLATEGPYKLVRHPFYSSYLVLYLGISIAYQDTPSYLLTLLGFAIYTHGARSEEEKIKNSPLGSDYQAYKSKVRGRFIPFLY